ncbi:hypothetical protein [Flavihumibacter petaseus]|uniref:Uncharacterized protein n=1 Tax=Flavihumibacter petaseus NBRC 106054 TaxID=1220578 RepID=A0A0E9N315_9BACT|nr:hypothetical protein [Flavihumibacter petaseus]GAO44183.1 hypothetical protein FPE01S_03_02210 [Flavihumibacter petaseus NBRC 106054]
MIKNLHTRLSRHRYKLVAAACLLTVAGLAFASMGGEKRGKKTTTVKSEFTPIRTTSGFTLKAGPVYKGSMIFNQSTANGQLSLNSVITYQKGNTTYIMPYNHRINLGNTKPACDNTEMLKLRLRINK